MEKALFSCDITTQNPSTGEMKHTQRLLQEPLDQTEACFNYYTIYYADSKYGYVEPLYNSWQF